MEDTTIMINNQPYHIVARSTDELAQEVTRMQEERTVTLPEEKESLTLEMRDYTLEVRVCPICQRPYSPDRPDKAEIIFVTCPFQGQHPQEQESLSCAWCGTPGATFEAQGKRYCNEDCAFWDHALDQYPAKDDNRDTAQAKNATIQYADGSWW